MKKLFVSIFSLVLILTLCLCGCKHKGIKYTRGIGVYPGDPTEDFSPVLEKDTRTYRNIARLRSAFSSSAYDYNLTAQLVTDGIIETREPSWISVSDNEGILPASQREWLLDQNSMTDLPVKGNDVWIQYEAHGGMVPDSVNKISINGTVQYDEKGATGWKFTCSGSNDGKSWQSLKEFAGQGFPGIEKPDPWAAFMKAAMEKSKDKKTNPFMSFFSGPYGSDSTSPRPSFSFNFGMPVPQRSINQEFSFEKPVSFRYYKVAFTAPSAAKWAFSDMDFWSGSKKLIMVPSADFKSAWMSMGTESEWVYVDLGTSSTFNNVKLHWINKPAGGRIEVSENAKNWKKVENLPASSELNDDIKLKGWVTGRYVRISMDGNKEANRFILSELEVYGKGGMLTKPKPQPAASGNRLNLSGGNWKIQRASLAKGSGEEISVPGYDATEWIDATVPGTALMSYRNAGAIPDPNFGMNIMMISESFFNSDFWYRDDFELPAGFAGKKYYLNFDGINWKAEVFVNGKATGRIDGAFIRGKFDITSLLKTQGRNSIAVLIHKNDHPGVVKEANALSHDKNGGILGADNPTYHASIGWDWIPTIRGRNIGIWNDVWLSSTGVVTITDPFVSTIMPLQDTTIADLLIEAGLRNTSGEKVTGTFRGSFGDVNFEKKVTLEAWENLVVRLSKEEVPALHIVNPALWWPKGYGRQNLHKVIMEFVADDNTVSDRLSFMSGIRQMSFSEDNQILNIYINGRRFIGRGGNWGFPESNLSYRGREYDAAVAYHADMNFTMIRNWVGQTSDDEFFEACDRHGIMVWQDFCLANPADGPDPDNAVMFNDNAADVVKRIRNHPSIALYVGRNEGNPPVVIDTALKGITTRLHPGLHYISNSASGVVSGGGPYGALPVRDYFLLYGYNKFHSERGMPNVMNYESLLLTLPDSALWPQNNQWGFHDYTLESAQACANFNMIVEKAFGQPKDAKEFSELAQWINYNGYRGIFEGRSLYRQGMLLWMSHPAWPSMVWQTYDYFLDPTAAYFGCKKANEPIHIQWNPVFDSIEVVNYSAGMQNGLKATAQVINMDGSIAWEKSSDLDCREDHTSACFKLEFPEGVSDVHFIKLLLYKGQDLISDNFYWRAKEDGNYKALKELSKVSLHSFTSYSEAGNNWIITTTLRNSSGTPALMIRLKVVTRNNDQRILPVMYSDNYFSLMPGEQKTIITKVNKQDARGKKPRIMISGFNIK